MPPKEHPFNPAPCEAECYPVLALLSKSYPELEGRLSTCYSPVRHFTHPPKGAFSYDLHVLSTPPAFVLSQDQTLVFNPFVRSDPTHPGRNQGAQKPNQNSISDPSAPKLLLTIDPNYDVDLPIPLSKIQRPRQFKPTTGPTPERGYPYFYPQPPPASRNIFPALRGRHKKSPAMKKGRIRKSQHCPLPREVKR